jgi:1-acyl-sn-glycerol-3-phosphate acyltransferase
VPEGLTNSFGNIVRAGLMALVTAIYGLASLALSLLERSGRRQHWVARHWAAAMLRIAGCSMTVVGAQNLPLTPTRRHARRDNPTKFKSKPAIYACNHLSYMDTPAVFASLGFQFRILAKASLFKIPFLGWYLRRSGQVPVDSADTHASLRSLNAGVRTLRSGLPLVIFPEGKRSLDGRLQEFLSGMAYMAVRAGVPIVPMALIGTYGCLPMHVYHMTPKPFLLAIGPPIATKEYDLRQLDELTARVFAAIESLYDAHSK